MLDGCILGVHQDPTRFVTALRRLRRAGMCYPLLLSTMNLMYRHSKNTQLAAGLHNLASHACDGTAAQPSLVPGCLCHLMLCFTPSHAHVYREMRSLSICRLTLVKAGYSHHLRSAMS